MTTTHPQAGKKIFDRKLGVLLGVQLGTFLVLAYMIVQLKGQGGADGALQLKELGGRLEAVGVLPSAIKAYEGYLGRADLSGKEKSLLAFTLGGLSESEGRLEDALYWFYQVESFDASGERVSEARQKVVSLLERMKKFSAAQAVLDESTGLGSGAAPAKQGGVVVAKVGKEEFYLHQLNEALDELPPAVRENFKSKEGKANFLKKFVADQLLLAKAKKLGLADSPEIRQQLERIKKQIMIQKILKDEVLDKIQIDEQDLKNFFEAHREDYVQKATAFVSVIKVKEKDKAEEVYRKLNKGVAFKEMVKQYSVDEESKQMGGNLSSPVQEKVSFISESIDSIEANKVIFATEASKWTHPVLSQGFYYIFLVRSKEKRKEVPFEQKKAEVEADYRRQKEGHGYQRLIDDTLKTQEVKLFEENVK